MASRILRYSDARHAIRLSVIELLTDTENRRDKSTELLIFTSDDWDAYKNALVEVYGVEEQLEYKGQGRPPNPKKVPPSDLKPHDALKIEIADGGRRWIA